MSIDELAKPEDYAARFAWDLDCTPAFTDSADDLVLEVLGGFTADGRKLSTTDAERFQALIERELARRAASRD